MTKETSYTDALSNHETRVSMVAIGGSAGSFQVIRWLLQTLPQAYNIPLVIVIHRMQEASGDLAGTLQFNSNIRVEDAMDKVSLKPGMAYIAPAGYHLLAEEKGLLTLDCSAPVNYSRPSIDVFLESAAIVYKNYLLAVLLSGANNDGAEGLITVKNHGGTTVVQDPETAEFDAMPRAAVNSCDHDYILNQKDILKLLLNLNYVTD